MNRLLEPGSNPVYHHNGGEISPEEKFADTVKNAAFFMFLWNRPQAAETATASLLQHMAP